MNESSRGATKRAITFVDNFFYHRTHDGIRVSVEPHLGLMSLAATLEASGHSADILDPKILFATHGRRGASLADFAQEVAAELLRRDSSAIGFTAYGRSLPFVIHVARAVKRSRPDKTIVLGGPHATVLGREIMDSFPCFDVLVRYEAEPLIVPLIEALAGGRSLEAIPNLVHRDDDGLHETASETFLPDADLLPYPALHYYPIESLRPRELSIEAGRGCPYACTFCSTASFFRRRYRLKSNERMVAEMEHVRQQYGVEVFNLNHDLFGLHRKTLLEFCELVRGRGLRWKCSMRTDTLRPGMAKQLADAGCTNIYFGIETGSARLQRVVQKRLDLDKARETIASVVGEGMTCTVSFITGLPEETTEDQDGSLDLIGELLAMDPSRVSPQLHVLSPEPGSQLHTQTRSGSLPILGDSPSEPGMELAFDGVGPEAEELVDAELIRAHPRVFSIFHHYPSRCPRWRQLMARGFVTYLLPELGSSLTCHLVSRFFEGSLAKLVWSIVGDSERGAESYEQIMQRLRSGLERVVQRLAPSAPYLSDLVRFGRVAKLYEEHVPGSSRHDAPTVAWLAQFDWHVTELAQRIMDDPTSTLGDAATLAERRWFMFGRDPRGMSAVVPVSPELLDQLLDDDASSVTGLRRDFPEARGGDGSAMEGIVRVEW